MALIVGTPYNGAGTPFSLADGDNFIVQLDVLIYSNNNTAVTSVKGGHLFDVYGTIIGTQGISMGTMPDDYNNKVIIRATGSVASLHNGDDTIEVNGGQSTVINYGLVTGKYGIYFYSSMGSGSVVENYGTILTSQTSIGNITSQNIKILNTGTITSYNARSFQGGVSADTVTNKGTMNGDIMLNDFADTYEGNGGRVNGTVYGDGGNDTLKGGAFSDRLDGGFENDKIAGRGGKDILTGGPGADKFYYYAVSELGDTITDFTTSDFFYFKSSAFGNATVGTCTAANFWSNTTGLAHDTDDRFIYDTKEDRLWFDKDGTGPAKPVLVTDFAYDVALTRADIIIFA